jgi:hypothetical protein
MLQTLHMESSASVRAGNVLALISQSNFTLHAVFHLGAEA